MAGSELRGRRILFVNNFPGPGLGGGETHLLALTNALVEAGMEVVVACSPGGPVADAVVAAGAQAVPCAFDRGVPRALAELRSIVRRVDPELVHGTGWLTDQLVRWCGAGVPVLNTVHVMPSGPAAQGAPGESLLLRGLVERAGRARVSAFLAVSHAVADAVVASGTDPARVRVIHNGVDAAALRSAAAGAHAPDLPEASLLVGTVSRLEPVKGVEHLVRAAAVLARDRDDVAFVIAGEGPLRASLEALAESMHLGGRMRFLGHTESSAAVLSRLDVAVVPSLSEGMGIVAVEAMALGVPVVASEAGGLVEVLGGGTAGVLVPPGDADALAAALAGLLDDAGERHRVGQAGRERAEAEFSLEVMVARHVEVYRALLAGEETLPGPAPS